LQKRASDELPSVSADGDAALAADESTADNNKETNKVCHHF